MDKENEVQTWQERVLTTKKLRQLLRKRLTPLVPEQLARYFYRTIPEIYGPDAVEISAMLNSIVDSVRAELSTAGLLPDFQSLEEKTPDLKGSHQRLNTRERRLAADYAALLVWTSEAHVLVANSPHRTDTTDGYHKQKAIDLAREAVGWGGAAQDIPQLALCLLNFEDILHQQTANVKEAERLCRRAIDLLSRDGIVEPTMISLHLFANLAQLLIEKGEPDEALEVAAKAEKLLSSGAGTLERGMRVRILIARSTVAVQRNDLSSALAFGHQALGWSDPTYNPLLHSALLQDLALVYRRMEHLEGALEFLLNSITTLEAYGIASTGAWVYISTAGIYQMLGEFDKAHGILDRVLAILGIDPDALPKNPDRILLLIHGNRADLLIAEGEYERAGHLLEWAIEASHAIEFYSTEVAVCAMAATLCGRQHRYKEACRYVERAIDVLGRSDHANHLRLQVQLARWNMMADNIAEAERLLDTVEPELQQENTQRVQYLRLRAQLFEKAEKFPRALECEREAARIEVELLESTRERSIRYARIIAEHGVLEQSIEQEKERRERLEHNLAEVVVKLGEKEQIIREIRQKLKQEIAGKKREGEVVPTGSPTAMLRSLLSITEKGGQHSESPLSYIGTAGDEFVRQLRITHPNLTPRQERLCILIRAGLNAQEICTLLQIKSEGLKSHRKRLRKTLNLKEGESLEKAIAEL